MEYNMTATQQQALTVTHDLYKFVKPGYVIDISTMMDIIFAFIDKYENEFEEYVATEA